MHFLFAYLLVSITIILMMNLARGESIKLDIALG